MDGTIPWVWVLDCVRAEKVSWVIRMHACILSALDCGFDLTSCFKFLLPCVFVCTITETRILKSTTIIVELFISLFHSVSFWCVYLDGLL